MGFTVLSFFLVTLTLVCAAPAPLQKKAVSQEVFDRLVFYEQFSAAAYCAVNNNSTGDKLTCSQGVCPSVQQANTQTVLEFEDTPKTDATGYVATDSSHNLIIVAFRGSQSIQNFLTDANFFLTNVDLCSGCKGFTGFWASWLEVRDTITSAVAQAAAANPTYQIVVTGHSLGGAIATFAATALRNGGHKVSLYTYGAPRVGGPALSSYISSQSSDNYRVTHLNDPVPRLPPIFVGYIHISPEYYISSGNNVPVTPNDVTQLTGSVNFKGNAGNRAYDLSAHGWYFAAIAACSPNRMFSGKVDSNVKGI